MSINKQAEGRIKSLQKEFFHWVEEHPILFELPPEEFNDLRKRVFRGTFEAYRLGVIGPTASTKELSQYFLGWLGQDAVIALPVGHRTEVTEKCFVTALEAYRIGIMVALSTRSTELFGTSL